MGWFSRKSDQVVVDRDAELLAELDAKVQQKNDAMLERIREQVTEEAESTFAEFPDWGTVVRCPKCRGEYFEHKFGPYTVQKSVIPERLPSERLSELGGYSRALSVRSEVFDVLRLTCLDCDYHFITKTADYVKPAVTLEKKADRAFVELSYR